jgi:hypothetical protein
MPGYPIVSLAWIIGLICIVMVLKPALAATFRYKLAWAHLRPSH